MRIHRIKQPGDELQQMLVIQTGAVVRVAVLPTRASVLACKDIYVLNVLPILEAHSSNFFEEL